MLGQLMLVSAGRFLPVKQNPMWLAWFVTLEMQLHAQLFIQDDGTVACLFTTVSVYGGAKSLRIPVQGGVGCWVACATLTVHEMWLQGNA